MAVLGSAFMGIASAAPASAANCSFGTGQIGYNSGYLYQQATLAGCTDVDLVEFSYSAGQPLQTESFVDATTGGTIHFAKAPPTIIDTLCGRTGVPYTDACAQLIYVLPWCPPQTPHVVYGRFLYRLHRLATHTWGSWYLNFSPNQSIWC